MFNEEEAFVSPDADVFGEREHKPFKLHSDFAPTGRPATGNRRAGGRFQGRKPV